MSNKEQLGTCDHAQGLHPKDAYGAGCKNWRPDSGSGCAQIDDRPLGPLHVCEKCGTEWDVGDECPTCKICSCLEFWDSHHPECPMLGDTKADICECGEYRDQHDEKGCKICRNSTAPWDGCVKFRFFRRANEEELAHWHEHNRIIGGSTLTGKEK